MVLLQVDIFQMYMKMRVWFT